MKRLIVGLDETIAVCAIDGYANALPNRAVIARLAEYRRNGFEVVISTSRNMHTYNGNIGKVNLHTLPGVLAWLQQHEVGFDEIHVGKPCCGEDGFYIDDRAIRPSEFVRLHPRAIRALLDAEKEIV